MSKAWAIQVGSFRIIPGKKGYCLERREAVATGLGGHIERWAEIGSYGTWPEAHSTLLRLTEPTRYFSPAGTPTTAPE